MFDDSLEFDEETKKKKKKPTAIITIQKQRKDTCEANDISEVKQFIEKKQK